MLLHKLLPPVPNSYCWSARKVVLFMVLSTSVAGEIYYRQPLLQVIILNPAHLTTQSTDVVDVSHCGPSMDTVLSLSKV